MTRREAITARAADSERARVLELLRAYGTHATSFQILEEGFNYWFDPEGEGVVAYVGASGWWVAAAEPLAPQGRAGVVGARFMEAARGSGRRAAFFSVGEGFIEALRAEAAVEALKIGEQPEWSPSSYTTEGPERRGLRAQVNRARNKGVAVRRVSAREVAEAPGPLRAQIEGVLARWLGSRRMSAMRFMVDLQPFTFPAERRYYVAELGDRAVGFLAAVPVYGRRGWFFEDVIRVPEAPNGTVELLVDAAMRDAAESQDAYVTLGLAPLAGLEPGPGPRRALRWGLRLCHERLGGLYGFASLRAFKARFGPDRWTPQYLAVGPPLGIGALRAVLLAFAGRGLVGFGLDTLGRLLGGVSARAWSRALWGFAGLLVPWTVLLALADGERWFGDVSIQWAWVTFDAVMVCALGSLAAMVRRGRPSARLLCVFLAGATLTDFLLTSVQAMHLDREPSGWASVFIAAGMAGPLLATLFLGTLASAIPSNDA